MGAKDGFRNCARSIDIPRRIHAGIVFPRPQDRLWIRSRMGVMAIDDLIRRDDLLKKLDALSEIFRRRAENEDKGFLAVQFGVTLAIEEVKEAPSESQDVYI